ncbi:signal peptidase I, partial [bacterium]|nr:signal peptidase I [candidate division CSSED10-310 bacterium]
TEEKDYIKRVIGLPGEQLRIVQNKVYINGQPIDDPYVPEYFQPNNPPGEPPINLATMTIPIGHYFVSGDHRNRSLDSRIWANPRNKLYSPFIPEKYIIGKAAFRYWPLSKFGIIPSYEYDDPEVQTES